MQAGALGVPDTAVAMGPKRWFASRLSKEIAGWLCLLAVLALVTVTTSGVLQSVLILVALVPWIWAAGLPRSESGERLDRKPLPCTSFWRPCSSG